MFKKTFCVFMFLSVILIVSGMFVQKSFSAGSAYQQAQQASQSGNDATNSSTMEGARQGASQVFDTPTASPPPVDLSGKGNHPYVDPNDLKKYDPNQ